MLGASDRSLFVSLARAGALDKPGMTLHVDADSSLLTGGSPDKPSAIVSAIEGHSANIDVTYANGQPAAHLAYADDNPLAGLLVINETGSPVAAFPDREAVA
jgi:hypothetical protein